MPEAKARRFVAQIREAKPRGFVLQTPQAKARSFVFQMSEARARSFVLQILETKVRGVVRQTPEAKARGFVFQILAASSVAACAHTPTDDLRMRLGYSLITRTTRRPMLSRVLSPRTIWGWGWPPSMESGVSGAGFQSFTQQIPLVVGGGCARIRRH